jgi:hypothetical protein
VVKEYREGGSAWVDQVLLYCPTTILLYGFIVSLQVCRGEVSVEDVSSLAELKKSTEVRFQDLALGEGDDF